MRPSESLEIADIITRQHVPHVHSLLVALSKQRAEHARRETRKLNHHALHPLCESAASPWPRVNGRHIPARATR